MSSLRENIEHIEYIVYKYIVSGIKLRKRKKYKKVVFFFLSNYPTKAYTNGKIPKYYFRL